jgi:tyrocidine synthetase-3
MNNRFYPDCVPNFKDEPLKDIFEIKKLGDNVGEGVITKIPFTQGDVVFRFTGFIVPQTTQFSLQHGANIIHDPYFMGKILHRCEPNCFVYMNTRAFIAVRNIKAGEWITMNYNQTEEELFKGFECNCGDTPCENHKNRVIMGSAYDKR